MLGCWFISGIRLLVLSLFCLFPLLLNVLIFYLHYTDYNDGRIVRHHTAPLTTEAYTEPHSLRVGEFLCIITSMCYSIYFKSSAVTIFRIYSPLLSESSRKSRWLDWIVKWVYIWSSRHCSLISSLSQMMMMMMVFVIFVCHQYNHYCVEYAVWVCRH